MSTFICRITKNLRTTAYTFSHPQSSIHPSQSVGTDGDIPLARFYSGMTGENRHKSQALNTQESFQLKTDGEHSMAPKPFSDGNGYGEYAHMHERAFHDV